MIETINQREFGGKHRQPDEGRRVPRSGRRDRRPDEQPTEQLPRTDEPDGDARADAADTEVDETVREETDAVEDEYDEFDDEYDDTYDEFDDEYDDDDDDDDDDDGADDGADERAEDVDQDAVDEKPVDDEADDAETVDDTEDTVQHAVPVPDEPTAREPAENAAPAVRPADPVVPQRRVDRKRSQPRRRPPLLWVAVAVAVLAVVGLVVWAIGAAVAGPDQAASPTAAVPALSSQVAFGETVERADGWTIEVGRPTAARAVAAAELPAGADRAVQLEVTLTNTASTARDSAGWTIKAIADNRAVELIPADAGEVVSRTIRPGASLTFLVAVPLESDDADLQLEAAPAGGQPVLFVGSA